MHHQCKPAHVPRKACSAPSGKTQHDVRQCLPLRLRRDSVKQGVQCDDDLDHPDNRAKLDAPSSRRCSKARMITPAAPKGIVPFCQFGGTHATLTIPSAVSPCPGRAAVHASCWSSTRRGNHRADSQRRRRPLHSDRICAKTSAQDPSVAATLFRPAGSAPL
jgi:hypothetical protein